MIYYLLLLTHWTARFGLFYALGSIAWQISPDLTKLCLVCWGVQALSRYSFNNLIRALVEEKLKEKVEGSNGQSN